MEEWGNVWVPHHRLLYVLYGKIEDRRMEDLIHDHVVPYVCTGTFYVNDRMTRTHVPCRQGTK